MVVFSEGHKAETCRKGRIEVICGSMFSGKTEELIRRLKRATFARQRVEIFKPSIDVRYSEEKVVSHDNNSIPSTPVDSSASILLFTSEIDVVGIDEAQFFDEGLTEVCNELANNGIRVIVAGLDMDYKGNSLRSHSFPVCHCRRSDQSTCHLRKVRRSGLRFPPYSPQRQTGFAGGKRRIRTPVPQLLPEST